MNSITHARLGIAAFLVAMSISYSRAQVAANYTVATWYGFKTAAITYSLDDYSSSQYPVALPLFDSYGFKVTFNIVTGWSPSWTNLATAAANGHEIASHTVAHSSLSTLSTADQVTQLSNSQTTINSYITSQKCVTIAYPNCLTGDVTTIATYYIAGRICSGSIVSSTPGDFYNISSIVCGSAGSVSTEATLNAKAALAKSSGGWCVFLIHGIDSDGGYSPLSSTVLSSHLSYVNTNSSDYWVGTFANVVKYIKERNAASLVETTISSDSLSLVVADGLDNTMYDAAITIRRLMPTGWAGARVYLGTTLISSTTTTINGSTYVIFNVVPDAGTVYLANTAATVVVAPTVTSPVAYCQGDTATQLTATGTNLKWYSVSTSGTALSAAPVPSTTTAGSTTYYVSQTVNNVESSRSSITVTVNTLPPAPAVTTPIVYQQGATASALTATGTSLLWYTTATGGSSSSAAPTPSTSIAGTTSYYVSQTSGGCESQRATIAVTVVAPVVLTRGWNIIGCPLHGNPSLESALSSIWSEVETVKSQDSFYSSDNIPDFNSLSTVSWGQGYLVKVKSACTLTWITR